MNKEHLCISAYTDGERAKVRALAQALDIDISITDKPSESEAALVMEGETLYLTNGEIKACTDLSRLEKRVRPGAINSEMLVKAARVKGKDSPTLIDATAGMGEDSFILAAAGFDVVMYERNACVAALLQNGLDRAAESEILCMAAKKMRLFCQDSVIAMRNMRDKADVVLLDPMFPKREKSAMVKKKFQLIHRLQSPCECEGELLSAAMAAAAYKVVVKRPLKGEPLGGVKCDYSLKGKAIRYDCFNMQSHKQHI